jgi:hypothetical protein
MAATDYKYVVLGGGQAAGYIAREVGPHILLNSIVNHMHEVCSTFGARTIWLSSSRKNSSRSIVQLRYCRCGAAMLQQQLVRLCF